MKLFAIGFRLLFVLFCLGQVCAVDGADQRAPAPEPDPALQPIEDVPGLPRVLLIGDSISIGYTLPVRQLLAGKANVHRIPVNAAATVDTLVRFDEWVGTEKWDVIHFNWGLHDLRLMADGRHNVSLSDYEKNLRELVVRLRARSSHLLWCSTTPVPGAELDPPRRNEDVVAYNAAARRVMAEHGVMTNDLYSFAFPQTDRIRKPLNVHYTPKGYAVLAQQVAKCIKQALFASKVSPAP